MLCAILIRGQARAAKPIPADENFESTEGLPLIWELTTQPYNYVFRSPDAELAGELKERRSEQRWPSVYGGRGTATVTVPKSAEWRS